MELNAGIAPLDVNQEELAKSNTTEKVLTNDMEQYSTGTVMEPCTHVW